MSKTAALVKVGLTSGNRLERVTRIELAWPAWKTKPERLWQGGFLTREGKS
jgi:hypothetical protein